MKTIRGSGGGKGDGASSNTPIESPNSLRSIAYAQVMDLVCEGPIKGPAAPGLQWLYLDGVPVQNANGSYNFTAFTTAYVPGTQSQEYISDFPSTQSEFVVQTKVTVAAPVIRTISTAGLDAIRVTVLFPALYAYDTSTGNQLPTSVNFAIDLQTNGGGYVQKINETLTGKTTSEYERSYRIPVTGTGPWDIKIRRITADSGSSALANEIWFSRYTEVVDQRFSYPNSAIVATKIDSSQFKSIPTRGYDLKLLMVEIPVNYDPLSRTYTGPWDGTWKVDWTDNPAWCFRDYCVNTRYGVGLADAAVDKWALYTIAQYCDGLVPTGVPKRGVVSDTGITLTVAGAAGTLTRSSGQWMTPDFSGDLFCSSLLGGYKSTSSDLTKIGLLPGDTITVTGFRNAANNGSKTVTGVSAQQISISGGGSLVQETAYARVVGPAAAKEFKVGDDVLLAGLSTSSNNGRATIQAVTRSVLTMGDRSFTTEGPTANCSVTLQDPTEPRFRCNVYFQTQEQAYRVLSNMASIFRGMAYHTESLVSATQDSPQQAVALFTKANIVGKFTYTGSSGKARHTVAHVLWNDPAHAYDQRIEYVPDEEAIKRYGINVVEIPALGCTSQGQAHRVGTYVLASERESTESVNFTSGLQGTMLQPGNVIKVHDPDRAGRVLGGLVASGSTTVVTLDRDVEIEAGKTYTLAVILPDGSLGEKGVTNAAGTWRTLNLASALTTSPIASSPWILTVNDLAPAQFIVLSITPGEGDAKGLYTVNALAYSPGKYDEVDYGTRISVAPTSTTTAALAPASLTLTEFLIIRAGQFVPVFSIDWVGPKGAVKYGVQYRLVGGNWVPLPEQPAVHADVEGIVPGDYEVEVWAGYPDGTTSPSVRGTYTVLGKAAPPSNVANFVSSWGPSGLVLAWDDITDPDLDHYELRTGATWAGGTLLAIVSSNNYAWTNTSLPLPKVWVAAVDTTNHYSAAPSSLTPSDPRTTFSSLALTPSDTRPT